jgi:Dolichyl-phosphate-mannose-protein mannosyltransferase
MAWPTRAQPTSSALAPKDRLAATVRWICPALLAVLYVGQCAWFIRTQSLTYDEPVHIAEGLNAWRYGRFEQYNDHPPLARLWCTLPLLNPKWQLDLQKLPDSFHLTRIAPNPEAMAWRARAMNVLLGGLLAWLVWRAADRLFSRRAANFALALFVFSPALVAHFSIAATDGAATLFIFATAWELSGWRREPTWKRTLWLGLLLGLMLLAKFSTAPMFVLALLWMLLLVPGKIIRNPLRWNWSRTVLAMALACFVVWAGYFFHVSRLSVRDGVLTATFPNWSEPIVKPVGGQRNYSVLIPAGEYVEGFRELVRHNRHGQAAFFLGRVSSQGGWKTYYPTVILLKWPTVVLVLSLTGLALALRRLLRVSVSLSPVDSWGADSASTDLPGTESANTNSTGVDSTISDLWIMASFPAVYLGLAIFARFNIGERHILPLYPFALLFAALAWEWAAGRKRAGLAVLTLLAALNAADALRAAPGYLSYFNVFVRPAESYHLLTDSNLDWGQSLLALREYQRAHPDEQFSLSYFGSVDPAIYGIQARTLGEKERTSGTVIVSATNLSGQFLADPQSYRWLLQQERTEILDHSLHVFHVREK